MEFNSRTKLEIDDIFIKIYTTRARMMIERGMIKDNNFVEKLKEHQGEMIWIEPYVSESSTQVDFRKVDNDEIIASIAFDRP